MEPFQPTIPFVDNAFVAFVKQYKHDKFYYLGTEEIRPIDIIFRSLIETEDANAECLRYSDGSRLILVDPWFWYHSTDDDRTAVFYHEMGHCDLGIWNHATSNTIMNPYCIAGVQFAMDKDFYLHTLFIDRR